MRVIKPFRLSVFQRVLTVRRTHHLSLGLSVLFPFEAPEIALMEVAMWQHAMKYLGKDGALDEGMPKPRGEVLVLGNAYSPGGEPRPVFAPRLQVASVDKTVFATGRRRWAFGGPTDPELITEMPLVWENAFGGPGYEPNPAGMGVSPVEEDGAKVHWLPHLEDPKHLMKSPNDRPPPASFGPLHPTLQARIGKMGTYGKKWLETEFPGFAHDLDPEVFQVAAEDQRLPEYFQGGEPIVLTNLHPSKPRIETRVPRLRARCFVTRKGEGGEEPLLDLITRLETVILFPNIERGIALFRCMVDIAEDDAADVTVLLCALEKPDAPRSMDHYREVLAKRLDKEKRHLHSLNDRDLLPEREGGEPSFPDESLGDMKELLAREGSLEKRSRARMQSEIDKARLTVRLLGFDPDEKGLPKEARPPEKPPNMDELAEYVEHAQAQAAELQREVESKRKEAEELARKVCAEHGRDYDALIEQGKRESAGPPKFRADAELARMREIAAVGRKAGMPMEQVEAKIEDPAYVAGLRKTEQALLFMYRSSAHFAPPAPPLDAEAQARGRAEVERAVAAGESLAGRDLTGLDLRGANLAKANLVEALLEGADLSGCDLSGADLSGAVLARAKLAGAKLDGARLTGANLGEVDANGTSFEGLCLEKVELYKARFSGARFARADLRKAKFFETVFAGADLVGADASEALFLRVDLTGARFGGAKLKKAVFIQCTGGAGIDFGGANLEDATFVQIRAEKASFLGARAINMRVVSTSALPGANFAGADLTMANLRGVDLTGANFEGARAECADFSEACLQGARLTSLHAKGVRFIRTDLTDADLSGSNLMDAMLQKAKLAGARVERANLYRAVLLDAKGDDRTSFSESHVKRVVFMRKDG